jgi:hypothetical protein
MVNWKLASPLCVADTSLRRASNGSPHPRFPCCNFHGWAEHAGSGAAPLRCLHRHPPPRPPLTRTSSSTPAELMTTPEILGSLPRSWGS